MYLFSAPARTTYPPALVSLGKGTVRELGDQATSNRRTLNQYIHENGVQSCQIVIGVTMLHPGSMWNTMPAHTYDRRTEFYL
jgi:4-deoxy-L-threo-5-hexosulose-uronate ketol-isomerase